MADKGCPYSSSPGTKKECLLCTLTSACVWDHKGGMRYQKYQERATQIKELYSTGKKTPKELAKDFGLELSAVYHIINRERKTE